ncbi:MAG: hypothetical protein NTY53_25120, partial [Kiritimatiellaeota bacterium]|nr:hypothetical protein [Kiritimatiellota bacterium]
GLMDPTAVPRASYSAEPLTTCTFTIRQVKIFGVIGAGMIFVAEPMLHQYQKLDVAVAVQLPQHASQIALELPQAPLRTFRFHRHKP